MGFYKVVFGSRRAFYLNLIFKENCGASLVDFVNSGGQSLKKTFGALAFQYLKNEADVAVQNLEEIALRFYNDSLKVDQDTSPPHITRLRGFVRFVYAKSITTVDFDLIKEEFFHGKIEAFLTDEKSEIRNLANLFLEKEEVIDEFLKQALEPKEEENEFINSSYASYP